MTPIRKKVAIVGAGPGGLTAAMILAHRGFEVDLFEKESVVGGRNAELRLGDFRFDLGPTFLMMKFVLDKVFAEAGADADQLLNFVPLDPMYRLLFPDFSIDITSDRERMRQQIESCFPGQSAGLDRFFERESLRFKRILSCLETDYSSPFSFLRPSFLKAIPHIPLFSTVFDYLGNYFDPERLRLSFTFQAKYLGMSPWECPGFFVILPYIEHAFGIYHVQGGLSEISRAMAEQATRNGARIHLNAPVRQLIVEQGSVRGLELADGTRHLADETILNADFAHAMRSLVPAGALRKWTPQGLERKKFSCSTYMLYLGLNRTLPEIPHHAIVFADDYHRNTSEIFSELKLSQDFSFYIRNASVTDPTLAPEGKSAIYLLVPMPNQRSGIDWSSEGPRFRERLLDAIRDRTPWGDLRPFIEVEKAITPADWDASGVYAGATFNMAHTLNQMLYFRPHNKFEELDHCYLVGGGTHPGSGLPTIYQSGLIAANLLSA